MPAPRKLLIDMDALNLRHDKVHDAKKILEMKKEYDSAMKQGRTPNFVINEARFTEIVEEVAKHEEPVVEVNEPVVVDAPQHEEESIEQVEEQTENTNVATTELLATEHEEAVLEPETKQEQEELPPVEEHVETDVVETEIHETLPVEEHVETDVVEAEIHETLPVSEQKQEKEEEKPYKSTKHFKKNKK